MSDGRRDFAYGRGKVPTEADRQRRAPTMPTDREALVEEICRDVAELPDRSSPSEWPEAMLVTHAELAMIVSARFAVAEAAIARREAEVRAEERAACAKVAEQVSARHADEARRMAGWHDHLVVAARQRANSAEQIAAAIRARSEP